MEQHNPAGGDTVYQKPARQERKKRTARRSGKKSSPDDELSVMFSGLAVSDTVIRRQQWSNKTGLMYDQRMLHHDHPSSNTHIENSSRLSMSYDKCVDDGLVKRCHVMEASAVNDELLQSLHSADYIATIKKTESMTDQDLQNLTDSFHFAYVNNSSWSAARLAAGCVVRMTEEVVTGELKNGMALVRPPGHHAMEGEACGFCLFNNICLAARHALDVLDMKRILIVDWDVHHGQATQYMFYDDPRVLYFSIHRYEHAAFWPNLRESDYDFIGEGSGKGFNVNVPLNKTGMTNADYLSIFHNLLLPIAVEFDPELILISSGYDAALGCPEGSMQVHPGCYAYFVHKLMALARGKIVMALEGGYCLESLTEGVAQSLGALLGDPCPRLDALDEPSDSVKESILNCFTHLRPYWKSLCVQGISEYQPFPDLSHLKTTSWEDTKPLIDMNLVLTQSEAEKLAALEKLEELKESYLIPACSNRTCIVYDAEMSKHKNEWDRSHPERPRRISYIMEQLEEWGLAGRCKMIKSRMATHENVISVHANAYLDSIKLTQNMTNDERLSFAFKYNSVYVNEHSYVTALLSCGSLLNVVDEVCTNQSRNAAAIIRPPGHHAEATNCMGFCFINNVAVATRYAQQKYGLQRILILDWDVHHGNGSQQAFENDPSVLFISLHRHDNGFFYPSGNAGSSSKVGLGPGEGFNVNVAWNARPVGDPEYMAAFHHVVLPIVHEFNPQLIFVSAGFDAVQGDPLGGLRVSPECFGVMTHMLSCLAHGRVILALEGGYNLLAIAESMAHCVSSLLGDACPTLKCSGGPNKNGIDAIRATIQAHKPFWKCLKFNDDLPMFTAVSPVKGEATEDSIAVSPVKGEATEDSIAVSPVKDEATEDSIAVSPVKDEATTVSPVKEDATADATAISPVKADVTAISFVKADAYTLDSIAQELDMLSVVASGESQPEASAKSFDLTIQSLLQRSHDDQAVEMFAVQPLPWCEHLPTVQSLPVHFSVDVHAPCRDCGAVEENWLCLVCYQVRCGRYWKEHMLQHYESQEHSVVLSFSDLSVWCYACDSYVDNEILEPAISAVRISKFCEVKEV